MCMYTPTEGEWERESKRVRERTGKVAHAAAHGSDPRPLHKQEKDTVTMTELRILLRL